MDEFNRQFSHKLVWIPWQRPGFELAMMLERAVKEVPGCDGVVLGGHGLFTWGSTQRESYLNTITIIDQIGQFIEAHRAEKAALRLAAQSTSRTSNGRRLLSSSCHFSAGTCPTLNSHDWQFHGHP